MQPANQSLRLLCRLFLMGIFPMLLAAFSPPAASSEEKLIKSSLPLSADEIGIYKAVLHYLNDGNPSNVSSTTYPFSARHMQGGCLEGTNLENLDDVSRSFHDLTADVLPGKNMKFVDPDWEERERKYFWAATRDSTYLFLLSEIAFDKGHHLAVVSYNFWCGGSCGSGEWLVFKNVGGEWKKSDHSCGGWTS